jgi:hypothetical protein
MDTMNNKCSAHAHEIIKGDYKNSDSDSDREDLLRGLPERKSC